MSELARHLEHTQFIYAFIYSFVYNPYNISNYLLNCIYLVQCWFGRFRWQLKR